MHPDHAVKYHNYSVVTANEQYTTVAGLQVNDFAASHSLNIPDDKGR